MSAKTKEVSCLWRQMKTCCIATFGKCKINVQHNGLLDAVFSGLWACMRDKAANLEWSLEISTLR